jgi:hypothetical protein
VDDRSGTEDWAWDKAMFCLKTGIAPSEYDRLTDDEIAAFVDAFNDLNSK